MTFLNLSTPLYDVQCRAPASECGGGTFPSKYSESLHRVGDDTAKMYREVEISSQIDDTVEPAYTNEFEADYSGINEIASTGQTSGNVNTND